MIFSLLYKSATPQKTHRDPFWGSDPQIGDHWPKLVGMISKVPNNEIFEIQNIRQ